MARKFSLETLGRFSQPQDGVPKDNVLLAVSPVAPGGIVTSSGGVGFTTGTAGASWLFDSNSKFLTINAGKLLRDQFGLLFVVKPTGASGARTILQILETGADGFRGRIELSITSTNRIYLDVYTSGGAYTAQTAASYAQAGVTYNIYCEVFAGTINLWVNGKLEGIVSGSAYSDSVSTYTIGGRSNSTEGLAGEIYAHAVIKQPLFNPADITINPYLVFEDFSSIIGISVASSLPTLSTPTAVSITSVGFIPRVTAI